MLVCSRVDACVQVAPQQFRPTLQAPNLINDRPLVSLLARLLAPQQARSALEKAARLEPSVALRWGPGKI